MDNSISDEWVECPANSSDEWVELSADSEHKTEEPGLAEQSGAVVEKINWCCWL